MVETYNPRVADVPTGSNRQIWYLDPEDMFKVVCSHFSVEVKTLSEKCRWREVVNARRVCYYFMAKYTDITISGMAAMFNQGHANAIHHIAAVEGHYDYHVETKHDIDKMEIEMVSKGIISHIIPNGKMLSRKPKSEYSKWTQEEIECLLRNYKSLSNRSIAALLNRDISSVKNKVRSMNLDRYTD